MKNNLILIGLLVVVLLLYYYLTKPKTVVITQEPKKNITVEAPKIIEKEKTIFVDMVHVDKGTFQMGGDEKENEKPIHSVTINDFYIGKYEVTQAQWTAVMGENPSFRKGDNNPVEKTSWYDAIEFCNRLSEINGLEKCYSGSGNKTKCDFNANGYRLPTEAEWEYAARGGVSTGSDTDYKYSGSDNYNVVAWHRSNSGMAAHPVGGKKPNEIGIYDMSGNVWEWVWDWYDEDYFSKSPNINPKGPDLGSEHVIRGGSWGGETVDCRIANRRGDNPYYCHRFYGFRVARNL